MPDIVTTTDQTTGRPKVAQTHARTLGNLSDDSMRDGVRLGMVVFITLAVLVGIYLLGVIGHRAGFATSVGVPNLTQSTGGAFVDGLLIPVSLLHTIYTTGVRDPLLFTGAIVVLLPPIAALVIARPRQRGAAQPRQQVRTAAGIGAALILLANILIAVRTAALPWTTLVEMKKAHPEQLQYWIYHMESTAAVDTVATAISILLAVLVFRLPIDRWVRATIGTCAIATCVITFTATAASGGAVEGLQRPRAVIRGSTGPSNEIILGITDAGDYAVIVENGITILREPETARVLRYSSVLEFLKEHNTP